VFTKTEVVNFTITKNAFKEQLLGLVAKEMEPKADDDKNKLIKQNYQFTILKQNKEEEILALLDRPGEKILDDENLVRSLGDSQRITEDIDSKLRAAKVYCIMKKIKMF
jgi:hypothetical protein